MITRATIICLLMVVLSPTQAQKQCNNWYFGYGAGLHFTDDTVVFQKGKIQQWEGCASISDKNGELLFYTNGRLVWNRKHQVMPNGRALKGHNSSTQSAIIVQEPGNKNRYFVFTVANLGASDGLQYCVVDMRASDGLGDVTEKSVPLVAPVCEKIAAVMHDNNKDVWVIARRFDSDEYYVYAVTGDGLNNSPVISTTGSRIDGGLNTIGYMKPSLDGKKLAAGHMTSFTEVMNFDNRTGRITNAIKVNHAPRAFVYGVEFSPNSNLLYTTEMEHTNGNGGYTINQYKVYEHADSMNASKQTIASGNVGGAAGALQLGPDNRIYVAMNRQPYLGGILYPDNEGESCGFQAEYVMLPSARSGLGLPSFVQNYLTKTGSSFSGYIFYLTGLLLLLIILFLLWRRRRRNHSAAR